MEPPIYLANLNPHPRDSHISFDEGPHIYTIDGDSDFMSVTTWNHSHFPHFNAKKIIAKMMKGKNWNEKNKYWGMCSEEIQELWRKNGETASKAGTKMHYDIECFYNDCEVEVEEDNVEWCYFEKFEKEIGSKMEPYRTEWMVWDKELKFAGSIDMIYENEDGSLELYDWKRSKGIKFGNDWENATTECIKHLPNCNHILYSLQLNTYKALLEKNYGKKVKGMYLVVLHPNNKKKTYHRIPVDDLQKEVADLFELRKKMLQKRT